MSTDASKDPSFDGAHAIRSASRSALRPLLHAVCADPSFSDAEDAAEQWHRLLSRPLPKGVKYGRALQRLLGHPPTLHAVVEYKDVAFFLDEEVARVVRSPLDSDGWRALQASARLAACSIGEDLDRTPSREEIQSNIQTTKSTSRRPADASVAQACKLAYAALADGLPPDHASAIGVRASSADERELTQAWAEMMQSRPGFSDECARRSAPPPDAWTAVPASVRCSLVASLESSSQSGGGMWDTVDQLNSYTKLSSQVPTGVMSKIESMASKLASDLNSGAVTMDTLNLQSIGEQVLSGCDANELSKLTGNLGELLPILSQMGPGVMPPGMSIPGLPGMAGPAAGLASSGFQAHSEWLNWPDAHHDRFVISQSPMWFLYHSLSNFNDYNYIKQVKSN